MSISKVKIGNTTHDIIAGGITYCTCSTDAGTAAKVATVASGNFTLFTGATVNVKFTKSNTIASPTLNVANTGAKAIYWHGSALTSSQYWEANSVLVFIYNGNQWDLVSVAKDNNTTYGVATSSKLGLVKSGTDITVDSSGNVSVNDDSHNHVISNIDNLQSTLDAKVPTSRTVNSKALSANITLSASDVGAYSKTETNSLLSNKASITKKTTVSLSTNWSGSSSPYTQTVTISGITANSKVDIQPDATVIQQMVDDGVVAMNIVNNNGTLTAYAVGMKPTTSMTIQATVSEVSA